MNSIFIYGRENELIFHYSSFSHVTISNQTHMEQALIEFPPAQTRQGDLQGRKTRKQFAMDAIVALIESGSLLPGTVLLEGPIADRLGTSRMPVRDGLKALAAMDRIHRFDGRGYLVGSARLDVVPVRTDLRDINWPNLAPDLHKPLLPASDQIVSEMRTAITAVTPFGCYRISEQGVGEVYSVSRTVVRETLNRLLHLGIVEKDRWSHWIAGPLTAQNCAEQNQIRILLETEAFRLCAPNVPQDKLLAFESRLTFVEQKKIPEPQEISHLEEDLHVGCMSPLNNTTMSDLMRQSQLPLVVHNLAAVHLKTIDHSPMLTEHRKILECLIAGKYACGLEALRTHLDNAAERTRERLKVLSVLPLPFHPPYLKPFY